MYMKQRAKADMVQIHNLWRSSDERRYDKASPAGNRVLRAVLITMMIYKRLTPILKGETWK